MSCHCNKCVQLCNPRKSICSPQSNPCPQSNYNNSECNNYGSWDNYKCGCGCNNDRRYYDDRRYRDDCDERKSNRLYSSERNQVANHKQCNKCYRRQCDCVEYYPYLRTKCGFISATLTKSANPTLYTAAGQIITYYYTITNTGSAPICSPIQICDDKLGGQSIPSSYILPGSSQIITRTYTISPADLLVQSITNTAFGYIQVKRCKWVFTQPASGQTGASATITFGSADLSGTISQTVADSGATVLVTINNSAISSTAASGVNLFLPFPSGVTAGNSLALAPIGDASAPIVSTNGITITQASIAPGITYQYSFIYGPVVPNAYTWSGTITSATFDPNPANNNVSSTAIIPPP